MSQRSAQAPACDFGKVGSHELGGDAEPLGDLVRDIDVEALKRAVRQELRLRWICGIGRHADDSVVLDAGEHVLFSGLAPDECENGAE